MNPLVIASNMLNEAENLERWFGWVTRVADGGILIVDGGSEDGSIEYAKERGAEVVVDNVIQREGYGPARNHLRAMAKKYFPDAHWLAYFDADETISHQEFHQLRFVKEYLTETYDIVAFPRIDWHDDEMSKAENEWMIQPDWQARMSRLASPVMYIRRLHEQITGHKRIYASLNTPKINHFHRSAGREKRDMIGKLCAKLHMEDKEYGHTVPEHPKEAMYRERYLKEGL